MPAQVICKFHKDPARIRTRLRSYASHKILCLVTRKLDKDPIQPGEIIFPLKYMSFFSPSTQGRTEVNDPIRLEFELIWDFTPVLDIYKFGEDLIKNDWEMVETQFPLL